MASGLYLTNHGPDYGLQCNLSPFDLSQLFREIIQRAAPDFSVPVWNTPKLRTKRLVDASWQLPEHQEKAIAQ
jgi:hypothetical protein